MTDKLDHGEGCTCGCQDGGDEVATMTLEFDDGESVVVEPLGIFELEGKEYIALAPVEEESEDVYLYLYHELSDDEFEFLDIEDDDEFDRVCAEFDRLVEAAEANEK